MRIQLAFLDYLHTTYAYYIRCLVEWKNILQLLFLVKDNPPQYILALRSFLVLIRGPETLTDDERLSKLRIFMICWCQVTYLSCSLDGHTRSFCKRGKRGVHIEYTDDYSLKIEKNVWLFLISHFTSTERGQHTYMEKSKAQQYCKTGRIIQSKEIGNSDLTSHFQAKCCHSQTKGFLQHPQ